MAMGLFQNRVEDDPGWCVESAGTWSVEGQPAASYTRAILALRGIDIDDHRSRSLNKELLRRFNLILTMEEGHKEAITVEFPEIAQRVYLLSEMVNEIYNIQDPIGGTVDQFEMTAQEFENIFERGFGKIADLARD